MNNEENKVYEIGYLIVPTVAEESVGAQVSNVKNAIESKGGVFISEDFPKMRTLAYTMSKKIGAELRKFDRAYFGWVKFEMNSEEVDSIKKVLDGNDEILRFLIIKTVRENTVIETAALEEEKKENSDDADMEDSDDDDAPQASEEEIDKSIEKLVIE